MCQDLTPPAAAPGPEPVGGQSPPEPPVAAGPLITPEPAAPESAPPAEPETTASPPAEPETISIPPAEPEVSVEDWKQALMEEVGRALDQVDELPAAEPAPDHEAPDLYAFFEQLTVLGTEARKGNRRTAEAFSQWGEALVHFDGELRQLREHLARLAATVLQPEALPRPYCLSLIELTDRLERLLHAFDSPPARHWWLNDIPWRNAWDTQRQGLVILLTHVRELLKKAGVTRLETLGRPYDPTFMVAVATESRVQHPSHTVIEELAGGYLLGRDLLRPAQVKISINPLTP